MHTILVIDDDPLIADIIQALDLSWQVVPALDGLTGLDILRRDIAEGHPPELIILDIQMPEFDGYDTCILIRAVAPSIPIVPFTHARDDHRLPRYMQELHCMLPVLKGTELNTLRQRLRLALQSAPRPAQTSTAVFERLLQKAMEAEQQARTMHSSRIPIALFARSLVQRLGIQHLLETISDPPLHITPIDATAEAMTRFSSERPIVVASTSDLQHAFELHQRHQYPLLLIAHTFQEGAQVARMVHALPSRTAVGIVLADHTLVGHLSSALRALNTGTPYAEPLLHYENIGRISTYSAEARVLPELTPRFNQVVVLDFLGWTTAHISEYLHVTPSTVETYWSRITERLRRNRDATRVWVRDFYESRACIDALRSALARSN